MRIIPYSPLLDTLHHGFTPKQAELLLHNFDQQLATFLRQHIRIYSVWTSLVGLSSLFGLFLASGPWYYFFFMSGIWSLINLLIAIGLYYHTYLKKFTQGDLWQRFKIQWHIENMFWFNLALDLGYLVVGGLLLSLVSQVDLANAALFLGFAYAVLLQGGFLLSLDLFTRFRIRQNHQRLAGILKRALVDPHWFSNFLAS